QHAERCQPHSFGVAGFRGRFRAGFAQGASEEHAASVTGNSPPQRETLHHGGRGGHGARRFLKSRTLPPCPPCPPWWLFWEDPIEIPAKDLAVHFVVDCESVERGGLLLVHVAHPAAGEERRIGPEEQSI